MNARDILIALLRYAIRGEAFDKGALEKSLDSKKVATLFMVAQKHDVAHLVALALEDNGVAIEGEAWQGFLKEKEQAYGHGKADAVEKLLPVYDNLERALAQPSEDEAYKKGVEMTMTQLTGILEGLGVEIFGAEGDAFDPNIHNAIMHTEAEGVEENTITKVFQRGFKLGDKIVRFAMVEVAN